MLNAINSGKIDNAHQLELAQVEPTYANAMGAILILIQFNANLVPSVHDATGVEENRLIWITVLASLSILLGIGIVGWLVFSTLVRRLQRLRRDVQLVEGGQVDARLEVVGRDEIAKVSSSGGVSFIATCF